MNLYHKRKPKRVIISKWAHHIHRKSLVKRAIIIDRFRKLNTEFDNITDTLDEDLVNAIHNFHTRHRI